MPPYPCLKGQYSRGLSYVIVFFRTVSRTLFANNVTIYSKDELTRPSTIPYDPSLTLGNIVPAETMANVVAIAKEQQPADDAEDELNSMISLKRSIDMTIQEMIEMNIDVEGILTESEEVNTGVQNAAINYAKLKISSQKAIQSVRLSRVRSTTTRAG